MWRWIPALCLLLGLTGCGATVAAETTFIVQDPSRVAILRGDEVILPAGKVASEAPLGETDVEPAPGGHTQVSLAAVRAPTGEISKRTST